MKFQRPSSHIKGAACWLLSSAAAHTNALLKVILTPEKKVGAEQQDAVVYKYGDFA